MGRAHFPINYTNCLLLTINDKGLNLSILFPFRFLSPPLFIPWSRFNSAQKKSFLLMPYYLFAIRDHWARIGLFSEAGHRAKQAFDAAVKSQNGLETG